MKVAVLAFKPTADSYTRRIVAIDRFGHRGTTQPIVMQDTLVAQQITVSR
jgi:hypothetical protein